jgi:RNA polymerase sigma-70 factor (ECF subfamily)
MAPAPEAPSDAELITRVLVGDDRRAFGELVARHQSAVRGLLRRLTGGDLAQADDLAPLGTLKTHVARAKEKLRRQLEEVP